MIHFRVCTLCTHVRTEHKTTNVCCWCVHLKCMCVCNESYLSLSLSQWNHIKKLYKQAYLTIFSLFISFSLIHCLVVLSVVLVCFSFIFVCVYFRYIYIWVVYSSYGIHYEWHNELKEIYRERIQTKSRNRSEKQKKYP